jgi:hypothetical protein
MAERTNIEWMPIGTFPRDGTDFLVCNARVIGGFMQVVAYDSETGRLDVADGAGYIPGAFTHWTLLPVMPGENNG